MIEVFKQAGEYPIEFLSCVLLAIIPAFIWLKIFLSKHPENRFHVVLTFLFGMLSAVFIMIYQSFWGEGPLNLIFFHFEAVDFKSNIGNLIATYVVANFLIYMSVGLIEEVSKHYAVKKADREIFESIDDVIELSIVAALGFAFLENIGYFFHLVVSGQTHQLFATFIIRSIFVVFIHVLCSAVYGYFYGIGHFAKPYMQLQMEKGKKFVLANFLHVVFHFRRTEVFRERMMMEGLFISVLLHGIYDFLMEPNMIIQIGDFSRHASVIVLPLYLILGLWYLSFLLKQKENLQKFGHLEKKEVFIKNNTQTTIDQKQQKIQKPLFEEQSIAGYESIVLEQIKK